MGDRCWEWALATGERVVAKLESSSDTETVFLGARLVSRSRRGATPDGHHVRARGDAEGAYRGARQLRVFFAKDGCRLELDGAVIAPDVFPKSLAMRAAESRVLIGTIVALVLGAVVITIGVVDPGPRSRRSSSRWSSPAATTAPASTGPVIATRLPSTESHRSSNGLLTLLYPKDFRVTADVSNGRGASVIHLERSGGHETFELFSDRAPDTTDLWKLDALLQEISERSWPSHDTHTIDTERSDGTCHGEHAAISLRHISTHGNPVRQWSCVFVHDGHAFRFTTFTPDWLIGDETYLKGLVEAVTF